jgi:hypothetical protein
LGTRAAPHLFKKFVDFALAAFLIAGVRSVGRLKNPEGPAIVGDGNRLSRAGEAFHLSRIANQSTQWNRFHFSYCLTVTSDSFKVNPVFRASLRKEHIMKHQIFTPIAIVAYAAMLSAPNISRRAFRAPTSGMHLVSGGGLTGDS